MKYPVKNFLIIEEKNQYEMLLLHLLMLFLSLFPSFCPSLSHQPTIVTGSPGCLLRSAGSGLQPRRPTVVQLHTAGATDPGESPHPSPPGQGHLHRQAKRGGGRGRRGQG